MPRLLVDCHRAYRSDSYDDDDCYYEDVIGEDLYALHYQQYDLPIAHGQQGAPANWESRFKQEIQKFLEFLGTHNFEYFLDSLTLFEEIFYGVRVPSHALVGLMVGKFKSYALARLLCFS